MNTPSPATIATTIEVDVDELCTNTVTRTPIISPAIGLLNISFSENALPAALPPRRRNAELRKLSEQMNMYINPVSNDILTNMMVTRFTLPLPSSSESRKNFIRVVDSFKVLASHQYTSSLMQ